MSVCLLGKKKKTGLVFFYKINQNLFLQCTNQECLLKKRNLLKNDNSVDYDAVKSYMKSWVEANPEFQSAADAATSVCLGENGPPGPPKICEANRLMFCVGAVIFSVSILDFNYFL